MTDLEIETAQLNGSFMAHESLAAAVLRGLVASSDQLSLLVVLELTIA